MIKGKERFDFDKYFKLNSMGNDFKDVMSQRTDEELIKIVTIEREGYNPIAIEAAEIEIEKRNIDTSDYNKIKEIVTIEKNKKDTVEKNVVSSFTRFLHFIIDTIIWILISIIVVLISGPVLAYIFNINSQDGVNVVIFFGYLISFIGYYSIMEIKFQKTIAKFITKTKVVHQSGEKPSNFDIFNRTLCRLIPFDRVSFLFVKNGIHDFLSKTNVIKDVMEENDNINI